MSIGLLFWVMVVGLLFGVYTNRTNAMAWASNNLVLWVLALLGWKVFGPALHQ